MTPEALVFDTPPAWPAVYRALKNGTVGWSTVRGAEEIHGEVCLVLELSEGIKGIVPSTQAGLWPGQRLLELVGQSIPYLVTALDRDAGVAILSRRQALDVLARETWRTVAGGMDMEARVIKAGARLAVLEAGGVKALLPYSELSYGFVADPQNLLTPGRSLRVRVLRLEPAAKRLIVSLKALKRDPWLSMSERYIVGGYYTGIVHLVSERGLIVELEPGVMVRTSHHRYLQPERGERALVRLRECDSVRRMLWGVLTGPGKGGGL